MAKLIKLTTKEIAKAVSDFENALKRTKSKDGNISFSTSLGKIESDATIVYSEAAWIKMKALIAGCDKEVAWNGVARRLTPEEEDDFRLENAYYIYDIIVHPQKVTGVTVTTDQEEHEKWLNNLDDETFNNLRYQGHSHVNMGCSPSGTDKTLYEELVNQLDDNMFYIFQIWNKKGDCYSEIYDMEKNIHYEDGDVSVEVEVGNVGIEGFLGDAKEMIKTITSENNYKKDNTSKKEKNSYSYAASTYGRKDTSGGCADYYWNDTWRNYFQD